MPAKFKIPGLTVADENGKQIENPTPYHYRNALLALLKATGSEVLQAEVDGHLCAFVTAAQGEVPDAECVQYFEHLVEASKFWTGALEQSLAAVRAAAGSGRPLTRGGDA